MNPKLCSIEADRTQAFIERVPAIPRAVVELAKLDEGSALFARELAELAECEPDLERRLIELAVQSRRPSAARIETAAHAIAQLGSRATAAWMTAESVMRVFAPNSAEQLHLWKHSLQVALIAEDIAQEGSIGIDPRAAYVAGLVHDLGRMLLAVRESERRSATQALDPTESESLLALEESRFGVNHAEVGSRICLRWDMPPEVAEIVRLHHARSLPKDSAPQVARCVPIVQQADRLSELLLENPKLASAAFHERRSRISAHCMQTAGAPPAAATRLAERLDIVVGRSRELSRALGLDLGE